MKNVLAKFIFSILIIVFFLGCRQAENKDIPETNSETTRYLTEEKFTVEDEQKIPSPGPLEQRLIDAGLINIRDIDSTILVDLKYSSTDNFIGMDLYGMLENCYLQEKPARMLANAQKLLKQKHPEYSLLVFDGARPLIIQQKLWDTLDWPAAKKKSYVADPAIGSIHNYGSAVDLTIATNDGIPLDMGTPFDFFGELAHPSKEDEMLEKKLLTEDQIANRKLLRAVMMQAGFTPIKYEWWHFNALSRNKAKELYEIIE